MTILIVILSEAKDLLLIFRDGPSL